MLHKRKDSRHVVTSLESSKVCLCLMQKDTSVCAPLEKKTIVSN